MKSFIAALRNLVLPFGATSGRRIILDSDNGKISLYDINNRLVAEIGPTYNPQVGFSTYAYIAPENIKTTLSGKTLDFLVQDGGTFTTRGLIEMDAFDSPNGQTLTLDSGSRDWTTTSACALFLDSTFGQLAPTFTVAGDSQSQVDFKNGAVSQGRGLAGANVFRSNTATTTTIEASAYSISNVTFKVGRAYRITCIGLAQSSVAGDVVETIFRMGAGTAGRMIGDNMAGTYIPGNTVNAPINMDKIVIHTGLTDVISTVVCNYRRFSGSGNVALVADVTNPAVFMIHDIGAAADYAGARTIT